MSLPAPYFDDGQITLYCGDARVLMGELQADAIVADPPYGETSLAWDRWPTDWPDAATHASNQLWCFGSLRLFMDKADQFSQWKFAQDLIWEKHNGSSSFADRFRRVHEGVAHFYRGEWASVYKHPQFTMDATARTMRRKQKPAHWGDISGAHYASEDGGPRLTRSVLYVRSCQGDAVHPTQKPEGILNPLVLYSVPAGGVVLDPFAGSGSTLLAAKRAGRRAIGIEINEGYCRAAVDRLAQRELIA